jgi:hypothetical protein
MIVVGSANKSSGYDAPLAPWLNEIVFVPNGNAMPDEEWERLESILRQKAITAESDTGRELRALAGVSASS